VPPRDPRARIPDWVVTFGGIAWRVLAIGAVAYFAFQLLRAVSVVAIAVAISLFLASVLWAPTRWLIDRGWPPLVAALSTMAGALVLIVGLGFATIPQLVSGFADLGGDLSSAADSVRRWLIVGPLGLSETQVENYWSAAQERLRALAEEGLVPGATRAVEFITGTFLAIITTFFVIKDGRRMVRMLVDRLPEDTNDKVETAIRVGWDSLSGYMAGIAAVGLVDAVAIGLGLWIVGVPLVVPLSILVFFGAFFPLVGAFVSGLVAVAVAFVNGGVTDALIILALITAIQQLEGDVVLPLVFGQTLKLHPLLVLLGVAGGGIAFGLVGAFLTVPVIAVVVSVGEALSEDPERSYFRLARGVSAS
jgi:predicted PurR-regulated permease PerM